LTLLWKQIEQLGNLVPPLVGIRLRHEGRHRMSKVTHTVPCTHSAELPESARFVLESFG